MGISAPRENSIEIIALHPVKTIIGINPMRLISSWADSLYIIALSPV